MARKRVLLVIDYQRVFRTKNTEGTVGSIENLVKKVKWDGIIQTLWFNSQEEGSLYRKNLDYTEGSPSSRDAGLVKRFFGSKMFPRYDKYSCFDENISRELPADTVVYIAGWETDACVLGTCFDLFDHRVDFRVVTDCVASDNVEAHEAALTIIKRNFGEVALVTSKEVM